MTEHIEEVKALPSDLQAQFTRSDVVERIEENHKIRHNEILCNLDETLSSFLKEVKCETESCYSSTIFDLEAEFNACEQLLMTMKDDSQELAKKKWCDLQSLWSTIEGHFTIRNNCIGQLDFKTTQIESNTVEKINNEIEIVFARLEKIAFLLRPGIQEILDAKCEVLSSASLSRQRGHTASVYQLRMCNLKKHRAYHHAFKGLCSEWKQLNTEALITDFRVALNQHQERIQKRIDTVLSNLISSQMEICSKRDKALEELKIMQPPSSTKTCVYHWYNALTTILNQLEALHSNCIDDVNIIQIEGIGECKEQAKFSQFQLVEQSVVDESERHQIYQDKMLPVLIQIETNFKIERDTLQERLQIACNRQKDTLKNLFKFSQSIAHVWDCHDLERANLQQQMEDELNQIRHQHDCTNKLKEIKLDAIIDKLRQESNDEGLEISMKNCLSNLDEIKKSYHEFYASQICIVKEFPVKIKKELKQYDEKICSAFGVGRLKKTSVSRPSTNQKSLMCSRDDGNNSPTDQQPISTTSSAVERYLKTSGGTSYWIVVEPDDLSELERSETVLTSKTETTFITAFKDADLLSYPYLISIALPVDIYTDTKSSIRTQFLNHLDTWKTSLPLETAHHAQSKIEEIKSELDLRMYLHEPRSQRIQENIFEVRSAELLLHKNRVAQHCQAVTSSLSKLKVKFQETINSHGQQTSKLKQSIEKQESAYQEANNTHQLLKVHKVVSAKVAEYIDEISGTLRSYRKDFEDHLTTIRVSNNSFKKSLNVFSVGGNFSSGEVDECKRKLDRMSNKMDSSEGALMAELELIETQRLDSANDFSNKLSERFKCHLLDLTYMEKMQRWFGNTQLKIKTEVNKSNQYTHALAKMIAGLDRRIDAFSNPNMDKEVVDVAHLKESLSNIISVTKERSLFLGCYRHSNGIPSAPECILSSDTLSNQKSKTKDKTSSKKKANQQKMADKKTNIKTNGMPSVSQLPAQHTSSHSETQLQQRQSSSLISGTNIALHIASNISTESRSNVRESKSRDPARFDKYLIHFSCEMIEPNTFSHVICEMLKDGLDNLLAVAELYYRQRGNRLPTRPDAIHEQLEQCADSVVQRLQSYQTQAEDYLNSCVLELHAQIKKCNDVILKLPHLYMDDLIKSYLKRNEKERSEINYQYKNKMKVFNENKLTLETLLRPTLGHPQNEKQLTELRCAADERHVKLNNLHKDYIVAIKALENDDIQRFLSELNLLSLTLLKQADTIIIQSDIIIKVKQEIHQNEKQMLRAKMTQSKHSETAANEDYTKSTSEITAVWTSLPTITDLFESVQSIECGEPITSNRQTCYHEAIIKERDATFQKVLHGCQKRMKDVSTKTDVREMEEKRWYESWRQSIERILSFY